MSASAPGLSAWQDDLVERLTRPEAEVPVGIEATPGFRLTRRVQREWRAFRVRSSLPLTCRLLGPALDAELAAYVAAVAAPSSFFLREAEAFVAHLATRPAGAGVHVPAVARFELAMLHAVQVRAAQGAPPPCERATVRLGDLVAPAPGAAVVVFEAAPAQVLAAVATGTAPPPATGRPHPLLCTPRTCRAATVGEANVVVTASVAPRRAGAVEPAVLHALLDAGALVVRRGGRGVSPARRPGPRAA